MYLTYIDELNHEIMLRLDYTSTLKFCQTNKMFNLCNDLQFWQDKIIYDDHYLEIKNNTLQAIDHLKEGAIRIDVSKTPIKYILPSRIVNQIKEDLEELDIEKPDINKLIIIYLFLYNHVWYVKYIDLHNGIPFRFDYESTIEEINTILMKSYYYHYNTGMKISRVYK